MVETAEGRPVFSPPPPQVRESVSVMKGEKKYLQSPVDGSSGQSMSTGTAERSASVNTGYMWFLPLYSFILFSTFSFTFDKISVQSNSSL